MHQKISPNEVFVPGKFPIEKNNAYADRGDPQKATVSALVNCYVPLIYGGYGVGKSSMVQRVAQDFKDKNRLIYVETVYGKTLSEIFKQVLEELGYQATVQRTSSETKSTNSELGGEAEGSLFYALKVKALAKLSKKKENNETIVSEFLVTSPTESKIIDICEENKILLIIDELHRAESVLTSDLSAFIKAYSNKNCKNFKIALVGTENEASRLVISDPGVDRTIDEISLPLLTDEEANEVIASGFQRLEIIVPAEIRDDLIKYSVGSPFVLQYLCLEVAKQSIEAATCVTKGMVKYALDLYAKRKAQRLIREYMASIETTGVKRYRKHILIAMANSPDEYVTMEYLVTSVSKSLGQEIPSTALSGPLRQLKTKTKNEPILRDVENPARGGRLTNYSAFRDPAMKAIVRMVETASLSAD
jgi:hypothetical protein